MEASILDTRQRYSPINRAEQKCMEAQAAYIRAGNAYLANPSLENSDAYDAAKAAFKAAKELHQDARSIWKHTEGKKRPGVKQDGTDTTLKAQLEDAGFGDFGPY